MTGFHLMGADWVKGSAIGSQAAFPESEDAGAMCGKPKARIGLFVGGRGMQRLKEVRLIWVENCLLQW